MSGILWTSYCCTHGSSQIIVTSVCLCVMHLLMTHLMKGKTFYGKLQEGTGRVARHDVLICIGDFNAIMGCSNEGLEACTGKMGVGGRMCENGVRFGSFCLANDGGMSENGVRFGSFCLANDSVTGGTLFQHHNIHKATWVSPCGKYKNQIDPIAVSKRHRSSLLDVRVNQGADIGSDNHLSVAKIKLELKSQKENLLIGMILICLEGKER